MKYQFAVKALFYPLFDAQSSLLWMHKDHMLKQQHNLISLFKLSADLGSFFQEKYRKTRTCNSNICCTESEHEYKDASQRNT